MINICLSLIFFVFLNVFNHNYISVVSCFRPIPLLSIFLLLQLTLRRGDAFFCTQRLAYAAAPNISSSEPTVIVYFKLSHEDHEVLRDLALDDLWVEFKGATYYLESTNEEAAERARGRVGRPAAVGVVSPVDFGYIGAGATAETSAATTMGADSSAGHHTVPCNPSDTINLCSSIPSNAYTTSSVAGVGISSGKDDNSTDLLGLDDIAPTMPGGDRDLSQYAATLAPLHPAVAALANDNSHGGGIVAGSTATTGVSEYRRCDADSVSSTGEATHNGVVATSTPSNERAIPEESSQKESLRTEMGGPSVVASTVALGPIGGEQRNGSDADGFDVTSSSAFFDYGQSDTWQHNHFDQFPDSPSIHAPAIDSCISAGPGSPPTSLSSAVPGSLPTSLSSAASGSAASGSAASGSAASGSATSGSATSGSATSGSAKSTNVSLPASSSCAASTNRFEDRNGSLYMATTTAATGATARAEQPLHRGWSMFPSMDEVDSVAAPQSTTTAAMGIMTEAAGVSPDRSRGGQADGYPPAVVAAVSVCAVSESATLPQITVTATPIDITGDYDYCNDGSTPVLFATAEEEPASATATSTAAATRNSSATSLWRR